VTGVASLVLWKAARFFERAALWCRKKSFAMVPRGYT
jgi:hypothetical protein